MQPCGAFSLASLASLATVCLLTSPALATPKIRPAKPAAPTPTSTVAPAPTSGSLAPWVTVNQAGSASTITPHLSTVRGTETLISGAPNKLTASVQRYMDHGEVTWSTGPPPQPTATKGRAGAFEVCYNTDVDTEPWCLPRVNSTENMKRLGTNLTVWHPGTTYFVTWDASYFSKYPKDAEVIIRGEWINQTSGDISDQQAFASDPVFATTGFYPIWVGKKMLQGHRDLHGNNGTISLSMAVIEENIKDRVKGKKPTILEIHEGPTIMVKHKPKYRVPPGGIRHAGATAADDRQALLIGLPLVFGLAFAGLIASCLYNAKLRRLGFSNLVTKSRRGYSRGKSRLGKLTQSKKKRDAEQDKEFLLRTRDENDPELPGERHYEFNAPGRDSIDSTDDLAGNRALGREEFEKI